MIFLLDKQTEIDNQGISNEPFSIVGNARINADKHGH